MALIVLLVMCPSHARARAFALDSDIRARVESNRIITDAVAEDGSGVVPNILHFGYAFGEDPKDPFFVEDPGFSAAAGSSNSSLKSA